MKYSCCILFLLFLNSINAQIAIELEKMNVLYQSVENPLNITFQTVPDSNLLLIPSHGTIARKSTGQYIWKICKRETQVVFLNIFDKKADTLLRKAAFSLKRLPEPKIYAALKHDSRDPKCSGHRGIGVALVFQDIEFDIRAKNLGYDVTYIARKKDAITIRNNSPVLSSEVVSLPNKSASGDIFIFDNFQYILPCDGQIHYHSGAYAHKVE